MNSLEIGFRLALWDITVMPRRIQQAFVSEFLKSADSRRFEAVVKWTRETDAIFGPWDWNWNPAGPLPYEIFKE
jgi:hypothetical protein